MATQLLVRSNSPSGRLDEAAIALSGLCVVHCVASAVLLAVVASAGVLLHPLVHEVGLALALVFGAVALGQGIRRHGRVVPAVIGVAGLCSMGGALVLPHGLPEIAATLLGAGLLALGHLVNRRLAG